MASIHFTRAVAEESIQKKAVVYDADEDQHYDTISAFIKSMRGSDPDAALYWLAKMLYAGEDIRFIARRIVICASEDIGMADPQALVVAVAAQQAVEFVGHARGADPAGPRRRSTSPPRRRATAPTRPSARRMTEVKKGVTLAVPKHLRDSALQIARRNSARRGLPIRARLRGRRTCRRPTCRRAAAITSRANRATRKRVKERLDYWRALFQKEQKRR